MDHGMVRALLCQHFLGDCAWKDETGSILWVRQCGSSALCTPGFGSLFRGATHSAAPAVWEWGSESGKLRCWGGAVLPLQLSGPSVPPRVTRVAGVTSAPLRSPGHRSSALGSPCVPPALCRVGWSQLACAKALIPGQCVKHGCWDGMWARAQQLLALLWVENRKCAGWCLLSMPDLGQVAPLFTLTLTLPLIFIFL